MRLTGPDRYNLTFDISLDNRCGVRCSKGTGRFSGLSTRKIPKLYVVSRDEHPIYVGVTVRPMGERLRVGFTADGRTGYHGYAWRRLFKDAVLDVWCLSDAAEPVAALDAETVEAEVVFLIRQAGQWPAHQTEIHFHQSSPDHRRLAAEIMGYYERQRSSSSSSSASTPTYSPLGATMNSGPPFVPTS